MTDQPEPLEMTFEVAVAAGIDAVWDLISTADGRAAWFGTEASIELVVGGASRITWAGEQPIDATVSAIDPGRHLRLAYVADGIEMGAEEYWLDHADGVTRIRLIQSMPAMPGEGWADYHGDLERGWRLFLASLKFAAEEAAVPTRTAECRFLPVPDRPSGWRAVTAALGLGADPSTDDQTTVEGYDLTANLVDVPNSLLLVAPDRTVVVDLEGAGEHLVAYVQASTHGSDDAAWRTRVLDRLAAAT